jgi:hypothetical protein
MSPIEVASVTYCGEAMFEKESRIQWIEEGGEQEGETVLVGVNLRSATNAARPTSVVLTTAIFRYCVDQHVGFQPENYKMMSSMSPLEEARKEAR